MRMRINRSQIYRLLDQETSHIYWRLFSIWSVRRSYEIALLLLSLMEENLWKHRHIERENLEIVEEFRSWFVPLNIDIVFFVWRKTNDTHTHTHTQKFSLLKISVRQVMAYICRGIRLLFKRRFWAVFIPIESAFTNNCLMIYITGISSNKRNSKNVKFYLDDRILQRVDHVQQSDQSWTSTMMDRNCSLIFSNWSKQIHHRCLFLLLLVWMSDSKS